MNSYIFTRVDLKWGQLHFFLNIPQELNKIIKNKSKKL